MATPQGVRLPRLVLLVGAAWLVLTGGAIGGVLGLLVVAAAVVVVAVLVPPRNDPWHPWRLLRFFGYFVQRSLFGALDVGYRALHPRMPLELCWVRYRLTLPEGEPRVVMLAVLSLLPGTLAADLHRDELVVHSLIPGAEAEVADLERRVAALFSATVPAPPVAEGGGDG